MLLGQRDERVAIGCAEMRNNEPEVAESIQQPADRLGAAPLLVAGAVCHRARVQNDRPAEVL